MFIVQAHIVQAHLGNDDHDGDADDDDDDDNSDDDDDDDDLQWGKATSCRLTNCLWRKTSLANTVSVFPENTSTCTFS